MTPIPINTGTAKEPVIGNFLPISFTTERFILPRSWFTSSATSFSRYSPSTLNLEESNTKNALAKEVLAKLENGESFDSLKEQYNENLKKDVYKDGYYISSNDVSVYGKEITAASKDLNIGEYKLIDDGEVICVVMRKELVEKAYNISDYLDQFENILEYCKMADFEVYMKELMVDVKVYEDVISKYALTDINFISDYSLIV